MVDLIKIRENPEILVQSCRDKGINFDVPAFLQLDSAVLEARKKLQALQEEKNKNAQAVPKALPEVRASLIEKGKALNQAIAEGDDSLRHLEKQFEVLQWFVPNTALPEVPRGASDADNVEVRKEGVIPQFNFPIKDHVALLAQHGWAEFERSAKVCGSRSYMLRGKGVLLEMALLRFALDILDQEGFELLSVPSFVREEALFGTGHFPAGRDQVYYLPVDELYLSGTAEVPLNALHGGEILTSLPKRYAAVSPCFRREAGSAGRDVGGLMRVHQFMKVEQYILCAPDQSRHWYDRLLGIGERICQLLELPYRILACCTGDMGPGKALMHDIECWVPSENRYRETHSCSMLTDWQARRTSLRYRDENGRVQFCHTLNNTALASPRIFVPLLENHQQADGSIRFPQALLPYLGGT